MWLSFHTLRTVAAAACAAGAALTVAGATVAAPECRCRSYGRYYNLGEYACIRTPDGPRVALCGKTLNNSSWKFTKRRCAPTAARPMSPRPPARSTASTAAPR